MSVAALLLLLLGGPPDPLLDPSREVRERAIVDLALRGPPTAELLAALDDPDPRRVAGTAAALARRGDRAALPALARLADDIEGARGRAGAEALVAIAFGCDFPLDSLGIGEAALASARIEAAVRREVEELLAATGSRANGDRPQEFRRLFAGGERTARALRRVLVEGAAGAARAGALTILLKLTGGDALPECDVLLADADATVRARAAWALLRGGDGAAIARLAALAEQEGDLEVGLHFAVFHAIARCGAVGSRGAMLLETAVRERPLDYALAAANALRRADPVRAERVMRLRAERHLLSEAKSPGAGREIAVFHLLAGPLPPDLVARMASCGTPLLAAAAEPDTSRAIALLGELLAPRLPGGADELYRVRIIDAILRRPEAPWEARAAFSAALLKSEASSVRGMALSLLAGAPEEVLVPLRPQLLLTLADPSEGARVGAAALAGDSPAALRVLLDALYDGEPALAARIVGALRAARPGWTLPDPRAPVEVRRRAALDLRGRIDQPPRDME